MKHFNLFEAWDLSKGSKLPRKGDFVTIDPEKYSKNKEAKKRTMMKMGLPASHPFIQEFDAPDEILKRAQAGEIATVTRADNARSTEAYADLKFEDGFECGVTFDELKGMTTKQ